MSALTHCPQCGCCLQSPVDLAGSVEALRTVCRARGYWLAPDDRVREDTAAELLGIAPKTMKNRRYEGAGLPHVIRAGRPLYALADIATALVK